MTCDFVISTVGRRSTGNSVESGVSGARIHRKKRHGSENTESRLSGVGVGSPEAWQIRREGTLGLDHHLECLTSELEDAITDNEMSLRFAKEGSGMGMIMGDGRKISLAFSTQAEGS